MNLFVEGFSTFWRIWRFQFCLGFDVKIANLIPKTVVSSDVLGVFIIPSSKLVELINPIASNYGSEAARPEYGVVLGVGHGKNLQLAGCNLDFHGFQGFLRFW